jgi:hypothetical protein
VVVTIEAPNPYHESTVMIPATSCQTGHGDRTPATPLYSFRVGQRTIHRWLQTQGRQVRWTENGGFLNLLLDRSGGLLQSYGREDWGVEYR